MFFPFVFVLGETRIVRPTHRGPVERWVNQAANRFFVGNAQLLKRLETVQNALQDNAKVVVPANTELVNVIGDLAGVVPLRNNSGP